VRKAAICGTDIHIYNWDDWSQKTIPAAMVIRHEFTGEVAAIGSAVTGFHEGERVSAEGHITCGHCRNCGQEAASVPQQHGRRRHRPGALPIWCPFLPSMSFAYRKKYPTRSRRFSILWETRVHTALSFDMVGEDVLITGAGPIGVMAAAIARHVGARHVVVTDVNECRLGLAEDGRLAPSTSRRCRSRRP
jgi:threonine 3-dehydrogenase